MKKSFSSYVKDYLMLAVLVALIILFSILGPAMANRAFFNFSNLLTMLNQNAYLVILGVGITFIMLGGGMDLSTGYLISTVGVAMALIETSSNVVVAIICGGNGIGILAAGLIWKFTGNIPGAIAAVVAITVVAFVCAMALIVHHNRKQH